MLKLERSKDTGGKERKRIRRSPELLLKELDEKRKKLEERIYKKNSEAVQHIGIAILKSAGFDFTTITEDDIEDIENMTERGMEIVSSIVAKAHKNLCLGGSNCPRCN